MKLFSTYLFFMLVVGCGPGVSSHPSSADAGAPDGGTPDGSVDGVLAETQLLGMNDISMILPLPIIIESPVIGKINGIDSAVDLVPRTLFTRLATSHQDILNAFEEFQIFAIRFDLCDRMGPGPCAEGVDGSLRLVFQPLLLGPERVADVGLHAFYSIPASDLPAVVNELRAIARVSRIPLTSPLGQRPLGLEAIQRIRGLLSTYARADRLIRLSLMGQDARSSDLRTVFRGLEVHGGDVVDITVATLDATEQDVGLADTDPSYQVTPVADSPASFALTLTSGSFNTAAAADQRGALEALVATQNPLLHTASTVQCIACHTSTYLGVHRAQVAGIDLRGLTSQFSTTRDVRVVNGISATSERSLHAFSWIGGNIAISQRVANETAEVLEEIEQRFPVAAK